MDLSELKDYADKGDLKWPWPQGSLLLVCCNHCIFSPAVCDFVDAVVENVMSDLEKGDLSFVAVFTQGIVPIEEVVWACL